MVKFYLAEGSKYVIQKLLDKWSKNNPYATLDDIDLDYHVDAEGVWHILLAHQEDA